MESSPRIPGVALLALMLLAGEGARALGQAGATAEIVGTWRGTSRCVDRVAAPACNDEQVIYEISATPGRESAVTVNADKVVDGKRVPMGALDFARDPKDGSWTSEFETPRVHAIWRLVVKDTAMQGTLTLLPAGTVVRRIDLKKDS